MIDMAEKPRYRNTGQGWMPVQDGLQNLASGLGTNNDKRSHNTFQYGVFNVAELEAAYMTNWIARRIVQTPIDDGLREWRDWQCDEAADIRRAESRLRVAHHYRQARYWSRLYGGAGILMVTDQPVDQPLDVKKIRKGSLKRLVVLDRWDLLPQTENYYDPTASNYLEPETYAVTGGTTRIHASHIVRVDGEDLPRRQRALNQSWGDSKLRLVMEDLKDVTATKGGIAALVQEANVDVVKNATLSEDIANGYEDQIIQRYAVAAQMKSMINQLLLDGSEEYERKQIAFSGLGDVLDRLMTWVSGAAEMPATKLFGMAPQGENATGEGDQKNYYDSLAAEQENRFRPDLEQLDEVLVRSALGAMPEDCEWSWNPLYQESGTELAQQNLANAQADDIRLQQGVVRGSQVALKLKSRGDYAIEEDDIERMQQDEQADFDGRFDGDPDGEERDPDAA